ncbi:MAG: FG-GAP-like repeat-containing protein [Gallionellaceae bacterium]|nr:FG-GAP-like repeat-containing protein [Gallionellaceae bacterium]
MAHQHTKPTRGSSGLIALIFALLVFPTVSSAAERLETPVNFNVSPTGAANFSIPIEVPPGTAGMVPSLSLSYSSQRGNGMLGMGWSLGGLSAIYRCGRTLIQDGVKDTVNYDANDKYCLDGQRLVPVSATASPPTGCTSSTEYRTERESFTRVVSCGTAGSGPAYFVASTKAGQIIEFGNTTDSRIEAQGKTDVRAWAVNKISDTVNNYMTISYIEDNTNGDYRPNRIDYTGNTGTGLLPYNSVRFVYPTQDRSDLIPLYQAGTLIKTMKLLSNVQTYAKVKVNNIDTDVLVKDYQLSYDTSTATQRPRLASIKECDGATATPGATCLSATSIDWINNTTGSYNVGSTSSWTDSRFDFGFWQSAGDINGDGKMDMVHFAGDVGGLITWLANTDGSYSVQGYTSNIDTCLVSCGMWQTGDVNGDGKSDLIHITTNPGRVVTWLSNGDSTYNVVSYTSTLDTCSTTTSCNAWSAKYQTPADNCVSNCSSPCIVSLTDCQSWRAGDFDGDGRMDLIHVTGDTGQVITWLGNGDGNYNVVEFTTSADTITTLGIWQAGDANSDGKSDLIHVTGTTPGQAITWLAKGDGSYNVIPYTASIDTCLQTVCGSWQSGDVNGDGKIDLIHVTSNAGNIVTWLAKGDGSYNAISYTSNIDTCMTVCGMWQTGDVNGDGKTDLIHITTNSGNIVTWLSKGDGSYNVLSYTSSADTCLVGCGTWLAAGDVNGDGKIDLTHLAINIATVITWSALPSTTPPDLIASGATGLHATTGLRTTTSLAYKPLTDNSVYTKENTATYPYMDIQAPLYVVSSTTVPDGIGSTRSTNYNYTGAKIHLTGGGSMGFHQYDTTDLATNPNVKTSTIFRQDYPYQGLPISVTQAQSSGSLLKNITNTWSFTTYTDTVLPIETATGSKHHFPAVTAATEETYGLSGELTTRVNTTTEYGDTYGSTTNNYGNTTKITTSTNDGYSKVITNTYSNDPVKWFLGRLTRSTVTSTAP